MVTDIGGRNFVGAGRKIRSICPPIITIRTRSDIIEVGAYREMAMIICEGKNQKRAMP
jgi:hypothetical protein